MHETNEYKREEYVLRINRVLDYIDAHIFDPLTLDELAKVENTVS